MTDYKEMLVDQKLEISLIDSLAHSKLERLAIEGAELTLDNLLGSGLLKDIPIVNTLSAIYSTSVSIRNYLFMKKIIRFLSEITDIAEQERKKFVRQLDKDKEFKRKVGENVILLLERLDDMDKLEIVGKLFKAYILGRIQFTNFQRLASAVERIYLPDLSELKKHYSHESTDDLVSQRLAVNGLLSFSVDVMYGGGKMSYSINELGKLLVEICLIGR